MWTRMLGLLLWAVMAPFLAIALASLAMMLLPAPGPLWGGAVTLLSVAALASVPLLIRREAREAGDRFSTVAGAAVAGWSALAAILVDWVVPVHIL
ncbi:MAG: hypothetical protein IRZ26_06870 [Clostridia bacterium]|nr:hypothetical protein [Clostridia bacterium]MCL6522757.1 hypothetical protein [Bacillota bacterium]